MSLHGRTFGPSQNVQSGSVTLNDATSPQFVNYEGLENNYGVFHFQVPPGQDRLAASIAWPGNSSYCLQEACETGLNSRVRLILSTRSAGSRHTPCRRARGTTAA